jgi:hypothetical protein
MRFRFELEDLVAVALFITAVFVVSLACSYRLRAQTHPYRRSVERVVPTPQVVRTVGKTRAKRGSYNAQGGQLFKIGIIDTGYDKSLDDQNLKLCDSGHFDYDSGKPVVAHTMWHGTAVAQTIASELDGVNYCFVIFQVQGPLGITSDNLRDAMKKAATEGLIAVNMSLEGDNYSFEERAALKNLADHGTAVFIAAGNRHLNLDEACISFPGCYKMPNVYSVGATEEDGRVVTSYSNYGTKVDVWKPGQIEFNGNIVEGTSFASPHALGDYVHSLASSVASK